MTGDSDTVSPATFACSGDTQFNSPFAREFERVPDLLLEDWVK